MMMLSAFLINLQTITMYTKTIPHKGAKSENSKYSKKIKKFGND